MIGIFLVSFVAVFAAGLKKSISDVLSTDLKAQLFVSNSVGGGGIAPLQPGARRSRSRPSPAWRPSPRPASSR